MRSVVIKCVTYTHAFSVSQRDLIARLCVVNMNFFGSNAHVIVCVLIFAFLAKCMPGGGFAIFVSRDTLAKSDNRLIGIPDIHSHMKCVYAAEI